MLFFCFFFLCLFYFMFFNVHYIFLFLLIELVLLIFFMLLSGVWVGIPSISCVFFFLLVVVCMGGFGISLLISSSRGYGRDFWLFKFLF